VEPSQMSYVVIGEIAFRNIAGEGILVPVRAGVAEMDNIYTLNPVGTTIWQLLVAGRTVAEMAASVAAEFEVAPEVAQVDVAEFLATLTEKRLIQPSQPSGT
jgi:hypothetical protein